MNYYFIIHTMYLPPSNHHFDTMFVILCVIARATSHTISDTSKSSNNQLTNQERASFMDFILDANLIELLHSSSNIINKDLAYSYSSSRKPTSTATNHQRSLIVCAQFSNYLNENQMKFCQRYYDVFEIVIPEVLQLTLQQCRRITSDFRWNCPSIEHYLDTSSPLAFTREAALIRSILNASMMYLVLKTCTTSNYYSCGCQKFSAISSIGSNRPSQRGTDEVAHKSHSNTTITVKQEIISVSELLRLDSGSPVRISNYVTNRQGCIANVAFANAFTKVFIDSDDLGDLSKAVKVLNRDYKHDSINKYNKTRITSFDQKTIALVRWSRAAINIHNNHVGRKMVHNVIYRRCRCHGLSGACQYQTCWDQLHELNLIIPVLRKIYLFNSSLAHVKNYGTSIKPDLHLIQLSQHNVPRTNSAKPEMKSAPSLWSDFTSLLYNSELFIPESQSRKPGPDHLLFYKESPDYCEPLPAIKFLGTKGRACALMNNVSNTEITPKNSESAAELVEEAGYNESTYNSLGDAPGSCKGLCCNRGYQSELVLDMATCNCRFKYCCKVECEQCLRQRVQQYCL